MDELVGGSVEDDSTFIEDEELGAVVDAAVGDWLYLSGLLIEAVSGEEKCILQAMSDDERGGLGDIALFDDAGR